MEKLLDFLLTSATNAGASHPMALMQEGHVALELKKNLVDKGYTIREGSPRNDSDWLISKDGVQHKAKLVVRNGAAQSKPDIRIEEPISVAFELKVFGEFGSKDTFNRGAIRNANGKAKNGNSFLWDLEAVTSRLAKAAIVVCGARQYDTARGIRWDNRGRNAGVMLGDLLPLRGEWSGTHATHSRTWNGTDWSIRGLTTIEPCLKELDRHGRERRAPEGRIAFAVYLKDSDIEGITIPDKGSK